MSEHAEITAMPGTVRVLIPDLADDSPTWDVLEEVLEVLRQWETGPPRLDLPPLDLPAPLAGGTALAALQRVLPAVLAVTGPRSRAAGLGRLLSPEPGGSAFGIAAGAMVERMPLRIVHLDQADAVVLAGLPAALAAGNPDVEDATAQVLDAHGIEGGEVGDPGEHLAAEARRLAGLLTVELNDAERALADVIAAAPPAEDVVLDAARHAIYRPLAGRLLRIASGGSDPLDAFAHLG